MLNIKGDKVEGELGSSTSLLVLEFDFQGAWVLVGLEGDRVLWISKLHNLAQVGDVDAKDNGLVASVLLEAFHAQV